MRMRHRIKLQIRNSPDGAEVVTYADHETNVPADIQPNGGNSAMRGKQLESDVSHLIECRFTGDYTPTMKIVNEETSDEYNIVRIVKKDGRRRRYLILANEVVE